MGLLAVSGLRRMVSLEVAAKIIYSLQLGVTEYTVFIKFASIHPAVCFTVPPKELSLIHIVTATFKVERGILRYKNIRISATFLPDPCLNDTFLTS